MYRIGGGQELIAYLMAFCSGVGNLVITPLVNNLTRTWPITMTRALAASPNYQVEWPAANIVGQRVAFKIASVPATGTDNSFLLYGLTVAVAPAAQLPVRGAL
jgi:hypothetical protein